MSNESEHMPSEDRLRELLVGRQVVAAEIRDERPDRYDAGPTGVLTLSDGTVLKVWGNDGGCACDAGCYPLADLSTTSGTITNVRVEEKPDDDTRCPKCGKWYGCEHEGERGFYRIFVVAEAQEVRVASFEGSDGSGYYGTGWWLRVEPGS